MIFFILAFYFNLFGRPESILLQWRFYTNEQLFIEKYTQQDIIKNGQLVRRRDLKDFIQLLPEKILPEKTILKGVYNSYEKDLDFDSTYKLKEVYELNFAIYKNGKYEVKKRDIMPTIRDMPTFPLNEIKPGEFWEADGEEVFEFRPPVYVPFVASYQFLCYEKKFGVDTAKILGNYILHYVLEDGPDDIPYKYLGFSNNLIWFDYNIGQPVYAENFYDILFIYKNGVSIEYKGFLKAYYNRKRSLTEFELKKEKEVILKSIPKEKDIDAKITKEGVVITLGEVFFEFDKADLKQEELKKLDKIGRVLKNSPNYDVVIKGHTDNVGSGAYNQQLSEKRAKNVTDYLIKNGYLDRNRVGYIGKGEEEPIYPNDTEENRKKNRRVEIIINPR